jgi:hypothetical protein
MEDEQMGKTGEEVVGTADDEFEDDDEDAEDEENTAEEGE